MLCDPGVFLDTLSKLKVNNKWNLDNKWIEQNILGKKKWIDKSLKDLEKETIEAKKKVVKFILSN